MLSACLSSRTPRQPHQGAGGTCKPSGQGIRDQSCAFGVSFTDEGCASESMFLSQDCREEPLTSPGLASASPSSLMAATGTDVLITLPCRQSIRSTGHPSSLQTDTGTEKQKDTSGRWAGKSSASGNTKRWKTWRTPLSVVCDLERKVLW